MAENFDKSDWVLLSGLTSKRGQELNGKAAQVQGEVQPDGRWPVRVLDGLHMEDYAIKMRNPILGPCLFARRYVKDKACILIKGCNLLKVPKKDMTTLVRMACLGESRLGLQPMWKELLLPRQHPVFGQAPNCPVPAHVGKPLILTKIDFPEHQDIKGKEWERSFMVNQPGTYLRIVVEDGLSDDQDYVGPCLVCRPGGHEHWTLADVEDMHAYLSYLLADCYGEHEFDAERDIGTQHYQAFLTSCQRSKARVLHAARTGNATAFWETFTAVDHVINDELLDAAVEGLSGEILGALITRSESDICLDDIAHKIKHRAADCGESTLSPKAMWFGNIVYQYNKGKALIKTGADPFQMHQLVRQAEVMYVPESRCEYGPPRSLTALGITNKMIENFPFPENDLRTWFLSSEFRAMCEKYISQGPGDESAGYFDGLDCDIEIVRKFYIIALVVHRQDLGECALGPEDKHMMRAEIRNLGWALYFRGSIDAMRIHHDVFRKALMFSPLVDKEFDSEFAEFAGSTRAIYKCLALLSTSWDKVGAWLH